MKKIITLLTFLSFSVSSFSQSVLPNPGFENWTQIGTRMDPDNWNTLNPNTAIVGVLTCIKATGADVHSGNSAIKLVTKSVLGQNANGLATTGIITVSPPGISGGVAYTGRPDSIVGWYKYTSVGGDNGFVEFQLLGSSSTPDTIGYVRFLTPASNVTTYTRFSAPIVYRNNNPVAKSIWILSSSGGFSAIVNSTLFVDDMELITNSGIGIKEIESNYLSLSPNPAQESVSLTSLEEKTQFYFYDTKGKLLFQQPLLRGANTLNLSDFASGLYFYSALADGGKIQRGKICISR
jgi:hypothetical protein